MDSGASPVAITALGAAAVTVIAWRRAGRLAATVIVKGTFSLVAGGPIAPAEPEPISADEEPVEGGLRSAGDLVPYVPRADVVLVGHIEPRDPSQPPAPVGLGVNRGGTWLIRKSIASPDATIHGFGAVSRRAQLRALAGPDGVLGFPEPFDWNTLHAAPPDQRVDYLQGEEWIALAGVYAHHPVFQTHLAGAMGVAKLFGQAQNLRGGRPIPLVCDTLVIDADKRRCHIVWRGLLPVSGADAFPHLHLVAGIELPGRPLAWIDPFQDVTARPAAPPASRLPPPPPPPLAGPPPPRPAAGPSAATPAPKPAAPRARLSGTAPVSKDALAKAITPFDKTAVAIIDDDDDDDNAEGAWYNSTAPLTNHQVAELLSKPALPFEGLKAAPDGDAKRPAGRSDVAGLPFVPVAPPPPMVAPPPPMVAPPPPMVAPPPPMVAPLPVASPPPPAMPPPAEGAAKSPKLGDAFLAALSRKKAPGASSSGR